MIIFWTRRYNDNIFYDVNLFKSLNITFILYTLTSNTFVWGASVFAIFQSTSKRNTTISKRDTYLYIETVTF